MKYLFIAVFALLGLNTNAQTKIIKASIPNWVNKISFSNDSIIKGNGNEQYLLIDLQTDIPKETAFAHYTIKLLNSTGVQENSDLSIAFDPAYQKIKFHYINIIRNGEVIDKLVPSDFKVFQRESNMERLMYDGSLTAVLNLTGIQKGDIIDYAYSCFGFNPITKGNFSGVYYQQYSVPVNRIYNRIICYKNNDIYHKQYGDTQTPKIEENALGREYIWDTEALDSKPYDTNVPVWYNPYRRVNVSTYNSWAEVVKQMLPLYAYNKNSIKSIYNVIKSEYNGNPEIIDIIRFVQDNIRYLGFENGIGAYKPNSPKTVFAQRYGDCKDKSLLLTALLRYKGVKACPCLVNTVKRQKIIDYLPATNVFNHCIVCVEFNGKDYFVDATASNQGGDIEHLYAFDYRYGLKIDKGETQLTKIPNAEPYSIRITEKITIDSLAAGDASFEVRSEYTGVKADNIRNSFASEVHESIQKNYLDFYSNIYPHIEVAEPIQIIDANIHSTNKLVIKEKYKIKDIWEKDDENNQVYCQFFPVVLKSMTDFPNSTNQKMPYSLGSLVNFEQTTIVKLPELWNFENDSTTIKNDNFKYTNVVKGKDSTLTCFHQFNQYKEYISGDSVETFLKSIEKIKNEYSYYVTYKSSDGESEELNKIAESIFFIAICLAILLCLMLYKYNPQAVGEDSITKIGGWMILPLIGLMLTPVYILSQLFINNFFDEVVWRNAIDNNMPLAFLLAIEIVYNTLFMGYSVLLIILFFKQRTSLPHLMVVFYAVNLGFLILDNIVVEIIQPGTFSVDTQQSIKEIVRAFVGAAIWIPFFCLSKRVKSTFQKKLKE